MLLIIFQTLFLACLANDLPSFLPRCSMDEPNEVGDCIVEATKTLKSRIQNGINEIGIPPYDPLVLEHFDVIQESSLANYSASLWNFTIRGMDNYDITEIKYDPATTTFSGKMKFDPLAITSIYTFEGSLLNIAISGNGVANVSLGPINGTFKIGGKLLKLQNVDFYYPKLVKVTLSIADMKTHLEGLFGGNRQRGALTNQLINENSKLIIDAATPALEGLSERLIMNYVRWLSKTFPFYKLFPLTKVHVT